MQEVDPTLLASGQAIVYRFVIMNYLLASLVLLSGMLGPTVVDA